MNIRAASIRRPVGGEGNFDAGVRKSSESKLGLKPYLRFRITQHERDVNLINLLKDYFDSGNVEKHTSFPAVILVVTKFSDLFNKVLPFFEKYPMVGVKQLDFQD